MLDLGAKWVRFAPNGTNPVLFHIRFQYILLLNMILRSYGLYHLILISQILSKIPQFMSHSDGYSMWIVKDMKLILCYKPFQSEFK